MTTPEGMTVDASSMAIQIDCAGHDNMVLNNRIRGRANSALSAVAQGGQQNTTFLMNDLQGRCQAGRRVY